MVDIANLIRGVIRSLIESGGGAGVGVGVTIYINGNFDTNLRNFDNSKWKDRTKFFLVFTAKQVCNLRRKC